MLLFLSGFYVLIAQKMSNLEQDLKQSQQVNPADIDRISFDNYQKLVTRIGWLNTQPKKFEDEQELSLLVNAFDKWIDNAYDILKVTRSNKKI